MLEDHPSGKYISFWEIQVRCHWNRDVTNFKKMDSILSWDYLLVGKQRFQVELFSIFKVNTFWGESVFEPPFLVPTLNIEIKNPPPPTKFCLSKGVCVTCDQVCSMVITKKEGTNNNFHRCCILRRQAVALWIIFIFSLKRSKILSFYSLEGGMLIPSS